MPSAFQELDPLTIIDLVEDVLDTRAESVCRPLASYINRVYEVPLADGSSVVIKFYRPGRWTEDAILDEHAFVLDLRDADLPVVAPMEDEEESSLYEHEGIWFALYPRKRGRAYEDPDEQRLQELGRTLARMHNVGDEEDAEHRVVWTPEQATLGHLEQILASDLFPSAGERRQYERMVQEFVDHHRGRFDQSQFTRIHGDCHIANLMIRPDESGIFLIDFDDMAMGPTVQDIWMLLPGTVAQSSFELEHLLYGYRTVRPFAQQDLQLVEALRTMRYIHFTSWCLQQAGETGTRQLAEEVGTQRWWNATMRDLEEQVATTLGVDPHRQVGHAT